MKLTYVLTALMLNQITALAGGSEDLGRVTDARYKADGALVLTIEGPIVHQYLDGNERKAQFSIKRESDSWWSNLIGDGPSPRYTPEEFEACTGKLLELFRSGKESKIGYMFTMPKKLNDGSYRIQECFVNEGVPYLSI